MQERFHSSMQFAMTSTMREEKLMYQHCLADFKAIFLSITKLVCLFILFSISEISVVYSQEPLVYSRCERTTATYQLTGNVTVNGQSQSITRTMTGL
ncbi:MAG: hypothetical protein KDE66_07775, partial [Nitrosomonas sp.]|nr:hypothetical protein [Nitrosomonas sp.]